MSETQKIIDVSATIIEKAADEIYPDLAKQAIQETGKMLARIPRAINAAFLPLDQWILSREFKRAETEKLLAKKLANIPEEKIVSPEPYVAIPALQAISYSMDSEELREMYANLLAHAINADTKNRVHPSFTEIIKQMSPLDAQNLSYFKIRKQLPIAEYRLSRFEGGWRIAITNVFLENPDVLNLHSQAASLTALTRLGLISLNYDIRLQDDFYKPFFEHPLYEELKKHIPTIPPDITQLAKDDSRIKDVQVVRGVAALTPFGNDFISICLSC